MAARIGKDAFRGVPYRASKQPTNRKVDQMTDYSELLIKFMALVKVYRQLVLKAEFDQAADVAVEMQLLTNELQQWSEDQCTETPSS
jgi:hypothetical protein